MPKWRVLDRLPDIISHTGQRQHVPFLHQIMVGSSHLLFNLGTFSALRQIHPSGLVHVIASPVLLRQELDWLLYERQVHTRNTRLQIYRHRLLYHLLLEFLLPTLSFGTGRHLTRWAVRTRLTPKLHDLRDIQLVLQPLQLLEGNLSFQA